MRWNRLFEVLVLPGALAAGGCDDSDEPGGDTNAGQSATAPGDDGPAATDAAASTAGDDGPAATSDAPATSDTGHEPATGSTSDASATDTGEGSGESGAPLECEGGANDPCGCLCCWVMDGCLNTDACCAGWSDCAPEPE
jgi:hypothetical protein